MKKYLAMGFICLLVVVILAVSVVTALTTEKYQLAVMGIMQGYEITELTDEAITFRTDTKSITYYSFSYGISELEKNQ